MKKIITLNNQAVMDIAIQEYGSSEGVWLLLTLNEDKLDTVTDEPVPGTELDILELSDISTTAQSTVNLPTVTQQQQITIGGGGGGGTSGEYVRLVGDDIIEGIKTFLTKIRTNRIEPIVEGQNININNVPIGDGVIDAGEF